MIRLLLVAVLLLVAGCTAPAPSARPVITRTGTPSTPFITIPLETP